VVAFSDTPPFERFGLADQPTLLMGMDVLRKFDQVAIDFPKRKIHFLAPKDARSHIENPTGTRIRS